MYLLYTATPVYVPLDTCTLLQEEIGSQIHFQQPQHNTLHNAEKFKIVQSPVTNIISLGTFNSLLQWYMNFQIYTTVFDLLKWQLYYFVCMHTHIIGESTKLVVCHPMHCEPGTPWCLVYWSFLGFLWNM